MHQIEEQAGDIGEEKGRPSKGAQIGDRLPEVHDPAEEEAEPDAGQPEGDRGGLCVPLSPKAAEKPRHPPAEHLPRRPWPLPQKDVRDKGTGTSDEKTGERAQNEPAERGEKGDGLDVGKGREDDPGHGGKGAQGGDQRDLLGSDDAGLEVKERKCQNAGQDDRLTRVKAFCQSDAASSISPPTRRTAAAVIQTRFIWTPRLLYNSAPPLPG